LEHTNQLNDENNISHSNNSRKSAFNERQDGQVKNYRVTIAFRNARNQSQELHWVVNGAFTTSPTSAVKGDPPDDEAVWSLLHEVRVHKELLSDIVAFLKQVPGAPRAKFLLNVPDFIVHDEGKGSRGLSRCHIVLEDITKTKKCLPLSCDRTLSGLPLGHFKVFLATLAQFHAAGIAWWHNQQLLHQSATLGPIATPADKYPFLLSRHGRVCSGHEEKLHQMYLSLLKWKFKGNKKTPRQILLFNQIRKLAKKVKTSCNNGQVKGTVSLNGVCMGNVLPSEVMFQYSSPPVVTSHDVPVCAAVSCLRDVHYGSVIEELATLFYLLPEPIVRSTYMVFMLQNYCHVLTLTLEMLNIEWEDKFRNHTFPKIVKTFFLVLPAAVLRAVEICMEQTDPQELSHLITNGTTMNNKNSSYCPTQNTGSSNTENEDQAKFENKFVPLTDARIQFLIRLMDQVKLPV